jgi:hypothetical protein
MMSFNILVLAGLLAITLIGAGFLVAIFARPQ